MHRARVSRDNIIELVCCKHAYVECSTRNRATRSGYGEVRCAGYRQQRRGGSDRTLLGGNVGRAWGESLREASRVNRGNGSSGGSPGDLCGQILRGRIAVGTRRCELLGGALGDRGGGRRDRNRTQDNSCAGERDRLR